MTYAELLGAKVVQSTRRGMDRMMFKLTVLALLGFTIWEIHEMNQRLQEAKDALLAEVTDTKGKLESIKTYLQGLPELVAAAVQTALENADADAETVATEMDSARTAISDSVDETLAAIETGDEEAGTGEGTAEPTE